MLALRGVRPRCVTQCAIHVAFAAVCLLKGCHCTHCGEKLRYLRDVVASVPTKLQLIRRSTKPDDVLVGAYISETEII